MSDFKIDSSLAERIASRAKGNPAAVDVVEPIVPREAVAPVIEKEVVAPVVAKKEDVVVEKPVPEGAKKDIPVAEAVKTEEKLDADYESHMKYLYEDEVKTDPAKKEGGQKDKPSTTESNYEDEAANPYLSKAKEYEKLLEDPLFKALNEFRKAGGENIAEFAKNIAGVDYDKMPSEELYAMDLKNLGATEDEIAEELERFSDKSSIEKKRATLTIRAELKKQQEERVKSFSMPVNKNMELERQAVPTAVTELNNTISNLVGKKHLALTITPEMGEAIRDYVTNRTEKKLDRDGNFLGYDIAGSVDTAIMKLYQKQLLRATAEAAKAHALDEALKLRQRPNRMDEIGGASSPKNNDVRTAIKEMAEKKWMR